MYQLKIEQLTAKDEDLKI